MTDFENLRRSFAHWASICYHIREADGQVKPLAHLRAGQSRRWRLEQSLKRRYGRAFIAQEKGRRGGFTTFDQAANFWTSWGNQGMDTLSLAPTESDMFDLFEITRRAIEHFPVGLLGVIGDRTTEELSFPLRDSHYYTGTAGGSMTGRGKGLKRTHLTEGWHARGSLVQIVNAFKPSAAGIPYPAIVIEGTPSVFGSEAHQFWLEAVGRQAGEWWKREPEEMTPGPNGFCAMFVPWWECDPVAYRMRLDEPDELGQLEEDELLLVARHGLDLEQIKWRRQEIAGPGGKSFFLNNYPEDPETGWLTSGERYYDVERLRRLLLAAPTPDPRLSENEDHVQVYGEPPVGESLVLGADVAQGVDRDRSAFVIRSCPSWRLVAEYASNRIDPNPFAAMIARWGKRWTPDFPAFVVPERNGPGLAVIRALRDLEYPVSRIYRRKPLDEAKDEKTDRLGWVTSGGQNGSYPLMLSAGYELFLAASEGQAQPPGAAAISDALSIVTDKDGGVSLNARDLFVAEVLAWLGRTEAARALPRRGSLSSRA